MPNATILLVEREKYYNIKHLTNTSNPLNKNKPYCNYSFDINEPEQLSDDNWFVSWFFHIRSPFELVDLELNWMNMKSIK